MAKIGIGVDVGGTSVKLGMFTRTGNLIKKWEIPTDRENNCANVLPDVAASIRKTLEEEGFTLEDLVGVGLGVPGPVQPTGYVEVCVNLHWKDRYPGRELSELLDGVRVEAGNDANVAARGEGRRRCDRQREDHHRKAWPGRRAGPHARAGRRDRILQLRRKRLP